MSTCISVKKKESSSLVMVFKQVNKKLTTLQLSILKDGRTELGGTGKFLTENRKGKYFCINCNNLLYQSESKFNSQCGWPAFNSPKNDAVRYLVDNSFGMERTEIRCSQCDGHLGHLFKGEGWDKILDLPRDERHCINSNSLQFKQDFD